MLSGRCSVEELNANEVIRMFNRLFADRFNTRLEGGGEEPIYLPVDETCDVNRLIFRSDYVSSALHEIAHWCIAGEQRRQLVDFGYWYHADGRTEVQQRTFETVEIKPQALEWIFSVAAGHSFNISVDNLSADIGASTAFVKQVVHQACSWCSSPMPARAAAFTSALAEVFGTEPLNSFHYRIVID